MSRMSGVMKDKELKLEEIEDTLAFLDASAHWRSLLFAVGQRLLCCSEPPPWFRQKTLATPASSPSQPAGMSRRGLMFLVY